MTAFQCILAVLAILILLASLVGYSVCVLASRADAIRTSKRLPSPLRKSSSLVVSHKPLILKHH